MYLLLRRAPSLILGTWLVLTSSTFAYVFNGYRWPEGSQIVMHLTLDAPAVALQDGSPSWKASAADALNLWNQYIDSVKFVAAGGSAAAGGDGVNSVFFSTDIYGDTFGSNVLAVTMNYSESGSGVFTECDVIFNSNYQFNSYRGPLQHDSTSYTYDFHRVALHEFGHVLGLDHPNEHGQYVSAQMNSIISDLDTLAYDDTDGAGALYRLHITSALSPYPTQVGQQFGYLVVANNRPVSFSAQGLPEGCSLNSATGWISGTPIHSGVYNVALVAYGPSGNASATLRITILPPQITSGTITSGLLGSEFIFQITAPNQPTSFDATNLPPGLSLDRTTGRITGVPTISGSFVVSVLGHGLYEDAVGSLSIQVYVPPPPVETPEATVWASSNALLSDPQAPYIYCASGQGLQVIDTDLKSVVRRSYGDTAIGVPSMSPDRRTLWIASYWSQVLRRIDLETQAPLPDLLLSEAIVSVREGLEGRLYGTALNGDVVQIDRDTGVIQQRLQPSAGFRHAFFSTTAMSPDGKRLYVGDAFYPDTSLTTAAAVSSYDVSGPVPLLIQRVVVPGPGIWYLSLNTASDSLFVVPSDPSGAGSSQVRAILSLSPDDLTHTKGTVEVTGTPNQIAISRDGKTAGVEVAYGNTALLYLFDTTTLKKKKTITMGSNFSGIAFGGVAFDGPGDFIYAAANTSGSPSDLKIYKTAVPLPLPIPPKTLLNVSTRLVSQAGDNVLIGGFIITGSEAKKVIVRATGPSLPVPGALLDPVLELHGPDGGVVGTNDNWNAHRAAVVETGLAPANEHEAAVVADLTPGAYTAIVRGVAESTGVALVELYDLSPRSNSRLANIATRGKVETGDNVMIGGFIIGGDQPTKVIVRAAGPSLAIHGVSGALADTTLELYDINGTRFASNDDWQSDQATEINASGLAPTDVREAAVVETLQPGNYTAIVRGKNNTTGVALVEIFNLETN